MDQNGNEPRTSSNWRNERYARMLESGNGADVYFLVGREGEEKQLICAHKSILAAVSNVFEGQFHRFDKATGTQEGTEEKPIEVPDVGPDAFRAMLKYIYAGDLSGIDKQNVLDVYNAGKKYMIDALVAECRQWLLNDTNLGLDNVLAVLKHAQFHEDKSLIEHCWTFVDRNAKDLLDSEEFLELNQADLCEMLGRNTLETDEFFLFAKLHKWAFCKCNASGLEPTAENKQKVVAEAIYQIRFPLLTQQQFTEYIVPFNLLKKDDIIAMYFHYSNNNNYSADDSTIDVHARYKITQDTGITNFQRKLKLQYPNRFNSQPRASKFRISIALTEEANR